MTSLPPRPMLAAKIRTDADLDALRYPIMCTPKMDGIRCLMVDGRALTRALKPIPNHHVRKWLEAHCPNGWDGELMLPPPATFQDVSSCFMSRNRNPPAEWRSHVFDVMPQGLGVAAQVRRGCAIREVPAVNRHRQLDSYERSAGYLKWTAATGTHVCFVPVTWANSPAEVLAFEATCLAQGFEGVMLRDPQGPYKHGRSTLREGWLLKLKRFEDSEAVVTGYVERESNTNSAQISELGLTKRSHAKAGRVANGALGALQVTDVQTGVSFEIGSGFTEAQRVSFWRNRDYMVGRLVKYKYFPVGVLEKPRHPIWLGWRSKEDMG